MIIKFSCIILANDTRFFQLRSYSQTFTSEMFFWLVVIVIVLVIVVIVTVTIIVIVIVSDILLLLSRL